MASENIQRSNEWLTSKKDQSVLENFKTALENKVIKLPLQANVPITQANMPITIVNIIMRIFITLSATYNTEH